MIDIFYYHFESDPPPMLVSLCMDAQLQVKHKLYVYANPGNDSFLIKMPKVEPEPSLLDRDLWASAIVDKYQLEHLGYDYMLSFVLQALRLDNVWKD